MKGKYYEIPKPLINKKEEKELALLTVRYKKITSPSRISKASKQICEYIPESIKNAGKSVGNNISQAELYKQCMKVVAEGFSVLEKQAAKMTISESAIVKKVNLLTESNEITSLSEICLSRGYNISNLVAKYRIKDLGLALFEGGATGAFGFPGLPFNLVLSTFLYYRAVQSIAMFYGYNVKDDSGELIIAGDVFMNTLSPSSKGPNEVSSIISKIMVITETTAIKQTAKKTWTDMASRGGMGVLLTQMRALANKAAQKALEKAGQKGMEESVFKGVFAQIGKGLTKKAIGKAVPVVGAIIGGLFDTAQMNTVIEYADVFYNKRFLLEKEARINELVEGGIDDIIDIDYEEEVNSDL